ncbi:hypothetical protein LKI01_17240 [Companilactobacillus paralimentarius]|uniref:Uncharacterized protein n=2 Tax=Companilactobacillus TaxID=2767879 RepID=A0A202FDV2_9LACO|nr:hypothetical protein LKACC16343_00758 [Companilactobacillus bobalius]OWF33789.1 hypothetical protein LKACC12383_00393 [Companilactobacillus kimchii]GEO47725.1 hypothetical protein LKI01_17240 [Companilactobacillus paralimentarius]GEO59026.1 hypothetical protein LBO01_21550 [Companilactobacillus paralimentarius]
MSYSLYNYYVTLSNPFHIKGKARFFKKKFYSYIARISEGTSVGSSKIDSAPASRNSA